MKIYTTTITLLTIAFLGLFGLSAHAESDDALAQLNREELRELRKSGNRNKIKTRLQEFRDGTTERIELSEEQREELEELREEEDAEAVREKLNEWGVKKPKKWNPGKAKGHMFQQLTEEQKNEIKEISKTEGDVAVQEKLSEWGIELAQKPEFTEEQITRIQELRDAGDKEALYTYLEEIGVEKYHRPILKRSLAHTTLTDEEKDVLQEARDIARAGDKETAREMIKEVFVNQTSSEDESSRGFFGFFKKFFKKK